MCARLAFTFDAVGIAKSASLHFLDGRIQRGRHGAARREFAGMNELGTSAAGDFLQLRRLEIVDYDFRSFRLGLRPGLRETHFPGHYQMRRSHGNGGQQLGPQLRLGFRQRLGLVTGQGHQRGDVITGLHRQLLRE